MIDKKTVSENVRYAAAYIKEREGQIQMLYDLVATAASTEEHTTTEQWLFFAKMVQAGLSDMLELSNPIFDYLNPLIEQEGDAA